MKKGILVNMSDLIERLKNVNDNLPAISRYSLEARSHAMKSALNTINASNNTVKAVSQMLHEDSEDTAENRDLQAALKNVLDAVNAVSYNWNKLALDTYASYLESYAGGKTISFEMKGKPVEVNIREYLEYLPNDINFADYLFESMATSSDIILRLADTAVKERKELARLKTLDVQKEAIALGKEYMAAGGRDFEFMFEKDNEGHKTGNYISEFNWGKFYRDRKQYLREHKGVFNAAEVFTAANSKGDGLVDKYRNPAYQRMMENPAQKKFYTEFMRIYQDMQDLLPENSMGNAGVLAIQMRKDSSQRFDLKGDLTKVFPHLICPLQTIL